MIQIVSTLLFMAIGLMALGFILAMLGQNQAAILSALAGRGAFPARLSPETGPAARISFPPRSIKRNPTRRNHGRPAPMWSRAA